MDVKFLNINTNINNVSVEILLPVLKESVRGTLILDYYKLHNKLKNGSRTALIDILMGYILTKKNTCL